MVVNDGTLISTGRSSKSVFRFATVKGTRSYYNYMCQDKTDARCPSLLSFTVVLLISLPMDDAMCENSPFPGDFVLLCRSRCLASELRLPKALLLRIESTHALNSFVRSCVDDMGDVYRSNNGEGQRGARDQTPTKTRFNCRHSKRFGKNSSKQRMCAYRKL